MMKLTPETFKIILSFQCMQYAYAHMQGLLNGFHPGVAQSQSNTDFGSVNFQKKKSQLIKCAMISQV